MSVTSRTWSPALLLLVPAALAALAAACGGGGGAGEERPPAASAAASRPSEPHSTKLLGADAVWHEHAGTTGSLVRTLSAYELMRREVEHPGLDARRAVELPVPGEWTAEIEVPPAATLHFSTRLAAPELGGRYLPVAWELGFEPKAPADANAPPRARKRRATTVLWKRSDAAKPPDGGDWRDFQVDLAAFAGRAGTLRWRVSPAPGFPAETGEQALPGFRAVLGAPALGTAADERTSVLFVTIDTLRRDLLSPYGGDPRLTPSLDAFAKRGVVVEQSWSTASWTLPSYASLVTAEYPSTHGAGRDYDRPWDSGVAPATAISDQIPTLVERFDAAGYRTQAFHNNAIIRLGTGMERGFDGYRHYATTGRAGVTAFGEWLGTLGDRPFFCFLHLADPHSPYIPPESYAAPEGTPDPLSVETMAVDAALLREQGVPEEDRDDFLKLYTAVVGSTDHLVGDALRLLERAGLQDRTLVVFHADHGEEFWDHGGWFHGEGHHVELTGTPLIFSLPGTLPSGTRVPGPFREVDVMPTVLDLVGLWDEEAAQSVEGMSLAHLLRGEAGPVPPPALSERPLYGDRGDLALTAWPWRLHLRKDSEPRLYDLSADPREQEDLAARYPERVADMTRAAHALQERAVERRRGEARALEVGVDTAHQLEQLGYAGSGE